MFDGKQQYFFLLTFEMPKQDRSILSSYFFHAQKSLYTHPANAIHTKYRVLETTADLGPIATELSRLFGRHFKGVKFHYSS